MTPAQTDASGLTQGAQRSADTVRGWLSSIPTPSRRPDTAWHDTMVRKAQAGFQRQAAEEQAAARKPVRRGLSRTPSRVPARVVTKRR